MREAMRNTLSFSMSLDIFMAADCRSIRSGMSQQHDKG